MKCMGVSLRFFVPAVCLAAMLTWLCPVYAQSALDQLESASNTGTLFDGSDGDRFGTDTEIDTSGSVPDVPPPTAVEDSTDTVNSQDVSEDTGSAESSQADDSETDTDGASGTEKAE